MLEQQRLEYSTQSTPSTKKVYDNQDICSTTSKGYSSISSISDSSNKSSDDNKRLSLQDLTTVKVTFDVQLRYKPIECIGAGAYGVVCSAIDNRTGCRVAIKKIANVFDNLILAKRTYRELKILRHFKHDNIISIREILASFDNLQDIYVIFDLMETDLHHIIHSQQQLTDAHIQLFLYQLLRGLKYIHSANVLHRDLKPSNVLINSNCELKIGDFGMARCISSTQIDHATYMTEYVATRWYRAPELMLNLQGYTRAIDIWSVGCIFAEMLGRRQLFPGKNYVDQLHLIISVLGTPNEEFLLSATAERVIKYINNLPCRQQVPWKVLYPNTNSTALSLLDQLLHFDPRRRLKVKEALQHPYLDNYHDVDDEPICVSSFDFDFEKSSLTSNQLKEVILQEIQSYQKSTDFKVVPLVKMPIKNQEINDCDSKSHDYASGNNMTDLQHHVRNIDDGNNVIDSIVVNDCETVKSSTITVFNDELPSNVSDQNKILIDKNKGSHISSVTANILKQKLAMKANPKHDSNECNQRDNSPSMNNGNELQMDQPSQEYENNDVTESAKRRRTARTVYMERCMKKKLRKEKSNSTKKRKKDDDQQNQAAQNSLTQSDKLLLERWKTLQNKTTQELNQHKQMDLSNEIIDKEKNFLLSSEFKSPAMTNSNICGTIVSIANQLPAQDIQPDEQSMFTTSNYSICDTTSVPVDGITSLHDLENQETVDSTNVNNFCLNDSCLTRTIVISPGKNGEQTNCFTVPPRGGVGSGYGLGYNLDDSFQSHTANINCTTENKHITLESVSTPSPPISASLLKDWLDLCNMSYKDLEELQKELELEPTLLFDDNLDSIDGL